MSDSECERIVTMAYRDERFRFVVKERTEDTLRGWFRWTDAEKARLHTLLDQEDEDEEQPWYLDGDGYRLADAELFQKSPWTMIDGDTQEKAVQRHMDWNSDESWFCLTPWFRIGDELTGPQVSVPDQLRAYFHDSTLRLHSYNTENRQLLVHIVKEIGPETGTITFGDVSFISIPDCFPGDAIKATPVSELPDEFWGRYSAYPDLFEPDDIVFQIFDQEGPLHVVVAKTISYEIIGRE